MPVCKDFIRCNVGGLSLQRFHLYDGTRPYYVFMVHPRLHLHLQRLKLHLLVMCHFYPVSQSGSLFPISRWLQVQFFTKVDFFFGVLSLFFHRYSSIF